MTFKEWCDSVASAISGLFWLAIVVFFGWIVITLFGCSSAAPTSVPNGAITEEVVTAAMTVMQISERPQVKWITTCESGGVTGDGLCSDLHVLWPDAVIYVQATPTIEESYLARGMWEWKILSESQGSKFYSPNTREGEASIQAVENWIASTGY